MTSRAISTWRSRLCRSVENRPALCLGLCPTGRGVPDEESARTESHMAAGSGLANCKKAAEIDNRIPAVHVTLARIHDLIGAPRPGVAGVPARSGHRPAGCSRARWSRPRLRSSGRIGGCGSRLPESCRLATGFLGWLRRTGQFLSCGKDKFQQAIQQYQHALQLTPDNAQVYLNLGAAYLDAGDPKLQKDAERRYKNPLS